MTGLVVYLGRLLVSMGSIDYENDIYYGDLMLIKRRVNEWAEKHPRGYMNKYGKILLSLAALAAIIGAYMIDPTGSTSALSPLTITIFVAFLLVIIGARALNKMTQPPFAKLYNVRFEATSKSIICYYQQGMNEFFYEIKDKNIKEWVVDEEAWCFYFGGKAEVRRNTKEGFEKMAEVKGFYMLIPFDEFEVDDIIAPYGDIVTRADGTLRRRFISEGVKAPCILK